MLESIENSKQIKEDIKKVQFFEKLSKFYDLYETVKRAILLSEHFNEKGTFYLEPMNQLRNALDHIFKAIGCIIKSDVDYSKELKEAEKHLKRAGYESLDLLIASFGIDINDEIMKFNDETLKAVLPEYQNIIKDIKRSQTKMSLSIEQREKKTNMDSAFKEYYRDMETLLKYRKTIREKIPDLRKYEKENSL